MRVLTGSLRARQASRAGNVRAAYFVEVDMDEEQQAFLAARDAAAAAKVRAADAAAVAESADQYGVRGTAAKRYLGHKG